MSRKISQGIVMLGTMMFFLSFAMPTEGLAGGEKAKPGEFPHTVQLSSTSNRNLFCGGSIIAPRVVLTAAHCLLDVVPVIDGYWILKKSPKSILVTAGMVGKREWIPFHEGQSRTVDRYVMHAGFDYFSAKNDIALVILEKPVNYNDKVQPVQLPPPNAIFPRGTLAGWGRTDWRNVTSPYLKKLELDLEDRETCNNDPLMMHDGSKVSDLELCAISERGSNPCPGDSGSPVTFQRGSRSLPQVIVGIVSWGKSKGLCGESKDITGFPDVSQYFDWIQDTMEAEGFGNLTKQLTCSESEGFFNCGEFGVDREKIKSRCILIEKKCDGVNNCGNGRDENETICAAKNTSDITSKPEQNETTTEETAEKDPEGTQRMETGTTAEPEPEQNEKEEETTAENDLQPSSTPKLEEPVETNEEGAQIQTGSTSEPEQDKKLEENTENNDLEASSTQKPEPVEVTDEESQITEVPDKEEKVCVWFSLFVSFATLILIGILIAAGYWLWNRRRSRGHNLDSDEV